MNCLAEAHGQSAVNLTLDQQWIDHGAEILGRGEAHDDDLAGLGIDLDLADVDAVGKGEVGRAEVGALVEPGLDFFGQQVLAVGGPGDVLESECPVGAGNREPSVGKGDVVGAGFQQMRGDGHRFVDDALAGQ